MHARETGKKEVRGTWGRNDEEGKGATEREQEQKKIYDSSYGDTRVCTERRQA